MWSTGRKSTTASSRVSKKQVDSRIDKGRGDRALLILARDHDGCGQHLLRIHLQKTTAVFVFNQNKKSAASRPYAPY